MPKENAARVENTQPRIAIKAPNAEDWQIFIEQIGFNVVGEENEADVVLWSDPGEEDWDEIIQNSHSIVIGDAEILKHCKELNVEYIKDVNDGEAIQRQLLQFAETSKEMPPRSERRSVTLPPVISPQQTKQQGHSFSRIKGSLTHVKIKPKAEPIEEEEPISQRMDLVLALPPVRNFAHRLQQYIQKESAGTCRVLEAAADYESLRQIVEQGKYHAVVIHRKLPGLEINLVDNIKELRNIAPEMRIILIESESDYFSQTFKSHLEGEGIEWFTIPELPGSILRILRKEMEDWDDELKWAPETPTTALPISVAETRIHKPILIAAHSSGGGVGKSTTTTQLAFVFRQLGYKTLAIELDHEKPSLARSTGIPANCPGLAAWSSQDFKSEEAALAAIKRTSRQVDGLFVLPVGPISPKKAVLPFAMEGETEARRHITLMLNAALKEYDIVIVDTNPILEDPCVFETLKRSDRVFYIMEATKVFLDATIAHMDEAADLGIDLSKYRIVLNKCTKKDPLAQKDITQALEMPINLALALDVEGYRKATDKGKPYKTQKGDSPWTDFGERILDEVQVPLLNDSQHKTSLIGKILSRFGGNKNNA
ncbi:AAA family ATPase [Desulfitobacterium sp. AusDCA]|uniref:AAA family ATPase n=1 Tax=Desulfitobacterium sp. AusDCA TaxID=3240383 RepID=UPI003DA71A03